MVKLDQSKINLLNTNQPLPYWMNKRNTAKSLGISVQAFDKWDISPIGKIGREVFFDMRTVVNNRLENAVKQRERLSINETKS